MCDFNLSDLCLTFSRILSLVLCRSYFPWCHVIKGRARHPQSQGGVERSNRPFKEALLAWTMDNKDKNWARYGMHVVNASLNRRPSRAKANYSPNQIFYGKKNDKESVYSVLGHTVVKMAETEAGLEAAYNAIQNTKDPISNEAIEKIIRDADAQFLQELRDEGVLIDGEDEVACRQHDDNENDSIGDDNLSNNSDGVENSAQKEKGEGSEVTGEDKTILANEDKTPDESTGGDSTDVRKSGDSAEGTGKSDSSDNVDNGTTHPEDKNEDEDEDDKDEEVPNDLPTQQKRSRGGDVYGDIPTRGAIRDEVFKFTKAQAKQVNNRRAKFFKELLEVGDICNVKLEGKIRGAEGPKYLPVAVMEVITTRKGVTTYRVATKHGYLIRKMQRQELHHMPLFTKDLLSIDEMSSDFCIAGLTEQVAVSLYSVVGVTGKCRCTGDCASPQTRCGCRAKGIFCTSKCHGGRGSIGDKKCTLRPPPNSTDICMPCIEEE